MKISDLTKKEIEKIMERINLTDEERNIFELIIRGKTIKEIASRLNISIRTTERRVKTIKEKIKKSED